MHAHGVTGYESSEVGDVRAVSRGRTYRSVAVIASLFAKLLADSPGIAAAMKAGKKTTISAKVWRAREQRWIDLGVISRNEESWGDFFKRHVRWPKNATVRFTVDGKEFEKE